jgi:uncharacterized protein
LLVSDIQRHDSLAHIPRDEWDQLASAYSLFGSWGWLHYLEGAPGPAISYLTVAGGGLRAGWPVTTAHRPANARYDLGALFPELSDGSPVLPPPYLVAGASRGYRATAMARDPAGMTALMAASLAASAGTSGLAVFYLDTADAGAAVSALRELGRPAVPVLTDAEAVITINGESLADHVAACRSRLRQRFRREMGLFGRSGLRLVRRPLEPCLDQLAQLQYELQQRHGQDWDLARTERSLRRLAAAAPADPLLLLAVDESDKPVGFSLSYRWGDTYYVRATGYEYARLRDACEYFTLTCYEPIRIAAQAGCARLHLGLETLRAKMIRGADLVPLWSVIVPAGHDIPAGLVRALNRSRVAALRNRFAAHGAAFSDPSWRAWQ